MPKTYEQVVEELVKGLDVTRVAYRKSSGSDMVPYLEGYDVIDRANEIFDFAWSFEIDVPHIERWQRPMTQWNGQLRRKEVVKDAAGAPIMELVGLVYVTGKVSVTLGDAYFTHADLGRSIIAGDTPESLDTALAGAATDCLKRCFRQLGPQFGNSLYDKEKREEMLGDAPQGDGQNGGQRQNGGNGQNRAPQGTNGQAHKNGAPKPTATSAPAPAAVAAAEGYSDEQVAAAKQVVIPAEIPLAGKTMGEAIEDKQFGAYVVIWLTGEKENQAKKKFIPANKDDEAVQGAAKTLVWMMKKEKWDVKF